MIPFALRSFGCRVNQAEAFAWDAELRRRGFGPADGGLPDRGFVVVNTCTLTGRADRDVRKLLRLVRRERPAAGIVLTGCLAEREPDWASRVPGVRLVVRNADKDRLPDLVAAEFAGDGTGPGAPVEDAGPGAFRCRAFFKIQDGCDRACAFCVIPGLRGRSASLPPAEVRRAVLRLRGSGYKEIVLAGVHLASYGRDLEPRASLLDLLRDLDSLAGDFRLRLSSLDPALLDGPLLGELLASPRIAPHFHLSLQHASDAVLSSMGRAAASARNRELLARLREASPDVALGADLMVGFPGESEDDFRDLAELVERSPLDYAHVFAYSPRPGTRGAERPQVPVSVRARRAAALRTLAAGKRAASRRRFIGRELDGIVVGKGPSADTVMTSNFLEVHVPPGPAAAGAPVRVRTTGLTARGVEGRPA